MTKTASPLLVTKSQYARMRGIDPALITRRVQDGLLKLDGPRELVDVAVADKALADALGTAGRKVPAKKGSTAARPGSGRRPSTAPPPGTGTGAGLTLHEARTVRARADAERAEIAREREAIELAALKATMVPIADVATVWGQELAIVRARLLAIPPRLALQVAAEADPQKCFSLLQSAVNEALRELSDSYTAKAIAEGGK